MRPCLALIALFAVGCGSKTEPKVKAPAPVIEESNPRAMSLEGPGGTVAIGGTLDEAKKAFPAPKDAEVFDTAMSFTIFGVDGWTWGQGMGTGFEAGLKDGKIVALALTRLDGPVGDNAIMEQRESLGEPTKMADGKTASMLVWEDGPNARFFIVFKGGNPLFGAGSVTLIGDKEQLKLLNYRADDPETFVKQMDSTVDQLKELEKKPK
jgi:hypothetical protein